MSSFNSVLQTPSDRFGAAILNRYIQDGSAVSAEVVQRYIDRTDPYKAYQQLGLSADTEFPHNPKRAMRRTCLQTVLSMNCAGSGNLAAARDILRKIPIDHDSLRAGNLQEKQRYRYKCEAAARILEECMIKNEWEIAWHILLLPKDEDGIFEELLDPMIGRIAIWYLAQEEDLDKQEWFFEKVGRGLISRYIREGSLISWEVIEQCSHKISLRAIRAQLGQIQDAEFQHDPAMAKRLGALRNLWNTKPVEQSVPQVDDWEVVPSQDDEESREGIFERISDAVTGFFRTYY